MKIINNNNRPKDILYPNKLYYDPNAQCIVKVSNNTYTIHKGIELYSESGQVYGHHLGVVQEIPFPNFIWGEKTLVFIHADELGHVTGITTMDGPLIYIHTRVAPKIADRNKLAEMLIWVIYKNDFESAKKLKALIERGEVNGIDKNYNGGELLQLFEICIDTRPWLRELGIIDHICKA